MRGAGGTEGGAGEFLLGFLMLCGGGYLLLDRIQVHSGFGWGHSLYHVGDTGVGAGMLLIPFVIGVGIMFYNGRNPLGWLLALGSVAALVVGVISQVRLHFSRMSLFELLSILVLAVGGFGLLVRGLRDHRPRRDRAGGVR